VKLIGLGLGVALLLVIGSGGDAGAASGARPVSRDACVLPANAIRAVPAATSRPPARRRHHHHHHRARAGNVAVDVPPTVFIRAAGRWLVITTNTGRSPRPSDTFYAIANGHAALASAALQRYVESACR
jgi:hypothetical protein